MIENEIPIVIDGPNFINRLLDSGLNKDRIIKELTLSGFRGLINLIFKEYKINAECDQIEFVCSKKMFGSKNSKFSPEERTFMLERLMNEKGVHIEEINLPGTSEKGVDVAVSTIVETFRETYRFIALVSEDKDYVPLLKRLREKGNKAIIISCSQNFPIELTNEVYCVIPIKVKEEWPFEGYKVYVA